MSDQKISQLTDYPTPLNADLLAVVDTANTTTKKTTWTDIKATLKAYFDTLYQAVLGLTSNVAGTGFTLTGGATPKTLTIPLDASVSGTNTGDQTVPIKATGAELDTGTDDAKFSTAKALKDSHNVPSVVPNTSGFVMTSNGTDWVSQSPGGGAVFSTTQVFSGTSPTTFTDLDLSSVIGVAQRVVMLSITSSSNLRVSFRTNGDTDDYFSSNNINSSSSVTGSHTGTVGAPVGFTSVIVKTDASGVVEWNSTSALSSTIIKVLAYW